MLALESKGAESSSEPSDRRDSIEWVESVDIVPSEHKSHVLLLLGLAYKGNRKADGSNLTAADKAEQSAHERARLSHLLTKARYALDLATLNS